MLTSTLIDDKKANARNPYLRCHLS